MIRRFFKEMPKKTELNKVSVWKIEVLSLRHFNSKVIYTSSYNGKLWIAYIKIRIKALLKDWQTKGSYYGIGWSISEDNQTEKEGQNYGLRK
jgi:hypothetical protein